MKESSLLTTEDAAVFLGLEKITLVMWRTKRTGPPFLRFSQRMVRYRLADLQEWSAQFLVTPEPPHDAA